MKISILLFAAFIALLGTGRAQSVISSDDFESYKTGPFIDPTPVGATCFALFDCKGASSKIVSPGAHDSKNAVEFSATYNSGYNIGGFGFLPVKQPTGNTSKNPGDYVVSFDFQLVSGFSLDPKNLEVHVWGTTTNSAVIVYPDTTTATLAGPFVHLSVRLNDSAQKLNDMPMLDTTDTAYKVEFVVVRGALDSPVTETFRVDNVEIKKSPDAK